MSSTTQQDDPVLIAQDSEQAPPEAFSPQLILTIANEHYKSPPSAEVTIETKENEEQTETGLNNGNESSTVDPKTDIVGHALSLAQASAPVTHVPVLKTVSPQAPVKIDESDMMIKMAQSRLALLQRHAVSPSVLKPANLASLERIGSDSEGAIYWYDGGRNMYQSPQNNDSTALPKESDLVLVCKSMVQWQNKLKQLRLSCTDSDSRLAQIIKEKFISRVRVATQRKPRDTPQTTPSTTPIHFPTTVTSTSTSSSTQLAESALNPAHLIQHGSILLLPQSHGGLLPVFANTAVIMPQNVPPRSIGIETHISTSVSVSAQDGDKPKDNDDSTTQPTPVTTMTQQQPLSIILTTPAQTTPTTHAPTVVDEIKIQPNPFAVLSADRFQKPSNPSPFSTGTHSGVFVLSQVEKEVIFGNVDKVTKSMEILDEVPIKKVEVSVEQEERELAAAKDKPPTDAVNNAVPTHGRSPSESNAIAALTELVQGRTSQEVMSAKLLLSLQAPPVSTTTASSSQSSPQTGSTQSSPTPNKRPKKTPRKQTPVASAKATSLPRESSPSLRPTDSSEQTSSPATPDRLPAARQRDEGGPKPSAGSRRDRPTPRSRGAGVTDQSSKLHQLKSSTSVSGRPMKEYLVETDSESSDSSSESSSDEDAQGSSSSSSSDSSNTSGEYLAQAAKRGQAKSRGRAARGRVSRPAPDTKTKQDNRKGKKPTGDRGKQTQKGQQASRGGRQSKAVRSLLVSFGLDCLPADMLADKRGKRTKQQCLTEDDESESSHDEEAPPKTRRVQDTTAGDLPLDLASYYSTQGGVDLDILSELTGAVSKGEEESSGGYRSKRKCVRVREEMSRLQEILDTDSDAGSKGGRAKGSRAKVPADPFSRRPRSRVNTRSQFTHKRRRRRKQPEEEEALWQPAKPQNSSEKLRPVYLFSTQMANKAAEAVWKGRYDNIIQFHKAQPRGPGFLRLPGKTEPKTTSRRSTGSESETRSTAQPNRREGVRRSGRLAGVEPSQTENEEDEKQDEDDEEEEKEEEMDSDGNDERTRRSGPGPPSPFTSSHSPASPQDEAEPSPPPSHEDSSHNHSQVAQQQSLPQTETHTSLSLKSPDSVQTPTQQAREEENYTICHGTPEASKATEGDARQLSSNRSSAASSKAQPAHHGWGGGYPPPGALRGSYPQVYNHKFHPMSYPGAPQAMPASNYPYPMAAYHWPHPHPQAWPGSEMFPGAHTPISSPSLPYSPQQQQQQHSTPSTAPSPHPDSRKDPKVALAYNQLVGSMGPAAAELRSHPQSMPPGMHQFAQSHNPSHHYHPAAPQDPSHHFPYSLDARPHPSMAHIHPMWQSSAQMPHQLHPMVQPHLPPQGMWHPHHLPHMMTASDHHKSGKGAEGDKMPPPHANNINQNNNNVFDQFAHPSGSWAAEASKADTLSSDMLAPSLPSWDKDAGYSPLGIGPAAMQQHTT